MAKRPTRHLKDSEIEAVCEWITSQDYKPRWNEVVSIIKQLFGVERTEQSVMRNEAFKKAMKARGAVNKKRPSVGKPTRRKIEKLEDEIDRLKVRIQQLEDRNQALLEERLEMVNFARSRRFTEDQIKRPLQPIDRGASRQ